MSGRERAHFVVRGEAFLLAQEWALPVAGVPGYERVGEERARVLLRELPASVRRGPGMADRLTEALYP